MDSVGPTLGGRLRQRQGPVAARVDLWEDCYPFETLLPEAHAIIDAWEDGDIGFCAEVLLAKSVLRQVQSMALSGNVWDIHLPRCIWCGTGRLTHDPKCIAFLHQVGQVD